MALLLSQALTWLQFRLGREEGQDGVEYAVVAVVIIAAVAAAYGPASGTISSVVSTALSKINAQMP